MKWKGISRVQKRSESLASCHFLPCLILLVNTRREVVFRYSPRQELSIDISDLFHVLM